MVDVVSVRVDDETRRRMRRLPHVNWTEVIRGTILKKIWAEERRREVDHRKIEEAVRITDSLRAPAEGCDGTEEIRRWRERR